MLVKAERLNASLRDKLNRARVIEVSLCDRVRTLEVQSSRPEAANAERYVFRIFLHKHMLFNQN
jgi:hypothetical protein